MCYYSLMKRFIITTKEGQWIASVYAEEYRDLGATGLGGQGCAHFYIDGQPVATIDSSQFLVGESGIPQWKLKAA
jgi:hypothetical protein